MRTRASCVALLCLFLFGTPSLLAANLLTNPALDPFGKIPEFKFCAVKAEKVEQQVAAE